MSLKTSQTEETSDNFTCHFCMTINPLKNPTCSLCGSPQHSDEANDLQTTWAFLVTSIILYIPANFFPIMSTTFMGEKTSSTIMAGVITLWQHGSYPIALIIFIASIFIPAAKVIALTWLCLSVHLNSSKSLQQKMQLYRLTEFVGRWSMVDIFVVAILVALIRMGNLMNIEPGPASLAFAAMVITTMLAAMNFNSKLIWQHHNFRESND